MTQATLYPGADKTTQWRGPGNTTMPAVNKLLLHSTESAGWPSYPTFNPTLTFNPWKSRGQRWRQHHPINGSASTLQNSGTYKTNRANVAQIEIVGYVDPGRKDTPTYLANIGSDAQRELSEFLAWIHQEWEVPFQSTTFKAYPASYGLNNGVRFTTTQFTLFQGVCGHQHAPGNQHGDPGNLLKIDTIINDAKQIAGLTMYPIPKTNNVYLSKLKLGQTDSDSVWQVQNALRKLGYDISLTGDYNKKTLESLARAVFAAADIPVNIINDI